MENLIKLFACSSDRVIITDYDFNILWRNKNEEIFSLCDENCAAFFENETLPLNSGLYFIKHNGLFFECRVINYPDCENGVYVIQVSADDVMLSLIKCQSVREMLENQSSSLREAVAGISISSDVLRGALDKSELKSEQKYIDITIGNCCKLLKTSSNFNELIRYIDGSIERRKIDLSAVVRKFAEKSNNVLKGKVTIKTNIREELYINADLDRLEAFLISLVVVVNDEDTENNIITITLERMTDKRIGDAVSITVAPDGNGTDNITRTFSEHIDMYNGDESNSDLIIVNRFCKTFDGTLIIFESSDKKRSFNVKFPFYDSFDNSIRLNTASLSYQDNRFSKYNIKYSKIIY